MVRVKPGSHYDDKAVVDGDAEIEINTTPTSASAFTAKDAASVKAVSLKFDAQLSF